MVKQNFLRVGCLGAWLFAVVLIFGASSVMADEGTPQKQASSSDGYCNLKIPAIRPSTLATSTPELKSSQTGDLIDFYGPCSFDAKSKEEVSTQKRFRSAKYQKL